MIFDANQLTINKETLFADLGYEPHSGQLEVHRSKAPRRVLACGVRWGKTRCAAMEALVAALIPRERSYGWIVAATYDLADKVFREVVVIVAEHLAHRIVVLKESEKRLVLRNLGGGTSEIRCKSADNPRSLLGEGLDWVIVDEAARLKPEIWNSYLSQRLIDRKGWALLISTPRGKGWFYDMWRRGREEGSGYASWNSPSWTNPHLDRSMIEKERDLLPERVYRQEYGAEFIEGSGSVFRNVREIATGTWQEPTKGEDYYAGLDLAKTEDYTVLVIVNSKRQVVFVDRFHRLDWPQQVARIRGSLERYNDALVYVDSTGKGEPVYEDLRNNDCRAEAYCFTAKSKAALIDNLVLMIEKRELTLPRPDLWPEGIEELESFQYSVTDNGGMRTGAPYGYHDDCVVGLALAAWSVGPDGPGYEVQFIRW